MWGLMLYDFPNIGIQNICGFFGAWGLVLAVFIGDNDIIVIFKDNFSVYRACDDLHKIKFFEDFDVTAFAVVNEQFINAYCSTIFITGINPELREFEILQAFENIGIHERYVTLMYDDVSTISVSINCNNIKKALFLLKYPQSIFCEQQHISHVTAYPNKCFKMVYARLNDML